MVMRILRLPDGRVKALVQGLCKARIESFVENEPATWASVSALPADHEAAWCVEAEALMRAVRGRVEELLPLKNLPPEVLSITANVHEPGRLADLVASNLRLRLAEAQEILEVIDPIARLRRVDALLKRELEVSTMQAEIQSLAKEEMSRGQREHFLREQMRAIQSELGEIDPRLEEIAEYRAKIEEAGLPAEAHEESLRQLRRLERMHPEGPEAQVVRSYLEWMVDLPWSKASPDQLDLTDARRILDGDHAHLSGIKDRILEFLGVRKLRRDSRGPILCFAGPPGVGKTSLGRSVARAMGREFVRISLGGIRDEAEIRGHRRTYVGALLPGRIVQGILKKAAHAPTRSSCWTRSTRLGTDFRGDPIMPPSWRSSIPSRTRNSFSDQLPRTLPLTSRDVMFISDRQSSSTPSRQSAARPDGSDCRIPGYTPEHEKIFIATKPSSIPRADRGDMGFLKTGSRSSLIGTPCSAHRRLDYTKEAGVRNLKREIASVCRIGCPGRRGRPGRGRREYRPMSRRSNARHLPRTGDPSSSMKPRPARVSVSGVATGMAWTPAGGDILFASRPPA